MGDSDKTNQGSEYRGDSDKTNQRSEHSGDSDKHSSDLLYLNHPCIHSSDLFYQNHPCAPITPLICFIRTTLCSPLICFIRITPVFTPLICRGVNTWVILIKQIREEHRADSDKTNQRSYWNTWVILLKQIRGVNTGL
jgi:hypothetical protein